MSILALLSPIFSILAGFDIPLFKENIGANIEITPCRGASCYRG